VNIHENPNVSNVSEMSSSQSNGPMYQEDDSRISIASLRDLQNTNLPKKTNRRKNKSDKNTIALDI
jgi:hypothetical protein